VDEDGAALEELCDACRRERLDGCGARDERPAVQLHDPAEARWLRRQVARERARELFPGERDQRVEAPLEADRRPGLLARAGAAAERAADVPRPDLDEVVALEQEVERPAELPRAVL